MSTLEERRRKPMGRVVLWFFVVGTAIAGLGFGYKMYEFFWALTRQEGFEFAGVHLIVYGLVAAGFLALLAHSFLRGHFSDIEAPKHEMLEREIESDRAEFE